MRNDKRKKIEEMTAREKRIQRRKWKVYDRIRRQKMATKNFNVSPIPPCNNSLKRSGNKIRGRKVVLKNRSKCVRQNYKLKEEMEQLKNQLQQEKRKSAMYKKRFQRMKINEAKSVINTPEDQLTPKSKATKIFHEAQKTKGRDKNKMIRRLLFYDTLASSFKQSYQQARKRKDKAILSQIILSQSLVKRYRLQAMTSRSVGLAGRKRMVEKQLERERKFQKDIESFFARDDVSRNTAGMKETITKNKLKKQKRFLNAPMKTLYKKFLREVSKKVSYTTFTRYRPFHVLKPADIGRDTCLCKTHTNIELKAKKLKQLGLLSDDNPHSLCEFIACNKNSAKCMYNNCVSCKNKILPFSDTMIDAEEKISYEKWTIVKETVEKTDAAGKKIIKENKKSKKIIVTDTISRLKESFQKDMKDFKRHLFNIKNQNREFKSCKENLMDNEAAILVDFSENYSCKLAKEIQSYHFGSSRNQATLHTGVFYVGRKFVSFATISESLDHSPAAIWAHLDPIFKLLKEQFPQVDTIHFFSDGPSTQYRQKKNFFLFSTRLFDLTFVAGTWSFFESSHGKGAADGVGSALKRKANDYVAYGKDIPDARTLFETLKDTSEVKIFFVTEEEIKNISKLISNDIKAVDGTQKIHQICANVRGQIFHRPLSCFCHENVWHKGKLCNCHLGWKVATLIKQKTKKCRIYTSSECDSDGTIFSDIDDDLISESVKSAQEEDVCLQIPSVYGVKKGTFVLVEFVSGSRKRTKYRYVGLCKSELDEDGDVRIMYLKNCGEKNTLFKLNESDISDVNFDQIVAILPDPMLRMNGKRAYYKFKGSIDVYEQS